MPKKIDLKAKIIVGGLIILLILFGASLTCTVQDFLPHAKIVQMDDNFIVIEVSNVEVKENSTTSVYLEDNDGCYHRLGELDNNVIFTPCKGNLTIEVEDE